MEQLLSRLSSLSYEILGIILPGLFTFILLVLLLVGSGDLLPLLSRGFFPRLSLSGASTSLEAIGTRTGFGILGPVLITTYFLGHILNWISRGGKQDDAAVKANWQRTWRALIFKAPKLGSFDPQLEGLFKEIAPLFRLPGGTDWRQFYPVAKNFLLRTSSTSLVTMYQNKYTLHRSITAGAALIFWLTLLALGVGLLAFHIAGVEPRWLALTFLMLGCFVLVWGFSDSYAYNWQMFGNAIVTETFSLLRPPIGTPARGGSGVTEVPLPVAHVQTPHALNPVPGAPDGSF